MDASAILAIAFGLAMDAFSVSVASGIAGRCTRKITALKMAFLFGAFQALMPTIGWLVGVSMLHLMCEVDHWIAFALLLLVGLRMIYEAVKPDVRMGLKRINLDLFTLMILSIATSIDALAVGISFAILNVSIIVPILVIGAVTFLLSLFGALMGERVKHIFSPRRVEALGGLVLIAIGVKILLEHIA
ncbi:MAG: manganese efflux pump MntP family protein [Candidatus Bathyarchaeota archaeon]|nr:manganese efflux pump MntP family protein [Candidatus Bathyarchaeota archaeon]MCX8177568.1 manganese efflux pump MntP family protein [Candidatus Bathyarchaeota archaeon]